MDTLKPWLSAIELWCHQHDIAPAVILALVFAVIADTVRFGSAIRTMVRIIRNTIAELSEANLRMRIEEQAGVRQRIAAYLTSDNAIYMRAFRLLMKTWFLAVLRLALFLLASLGPYNKFRAVSENSYAPRYCSLWPLQRRTCDSSLVI